MAWKRSSVRSRPGPPKFLSNQDARGASRLAGKVVGSIPTRSTKIFPRISYLLEVLSPSTSSGSGFRLRAQFSACPAQVSEVNASNGPAKRLKFDPDLVHH
jgi:hypothetical protein